MAINLCPCMPLQKGCMLLAVIDAVLSMINLGLMILVIIFVAQDKQNEFTDREENVGIGVGVVISILYILQILLAFRLYYGARNRDYRNCRIWLIVSTIVLILNVVSYIVNSAAGDFSGYTFAGNLIAYLYKLYEIFVVVLFLKELNLERSMGIIGGPQVAYPVHPAQQPYFPTGQVYVVPASQQGQYPMQQFTPTAQPVGQGYPAPVHHVTTN